MEFAPTTGEAANSATLYGDRTARRTFRNINWFKEDGLAERLSDYTFSWYALEQATATLTVPLHKANYSTIPLFGIISLSHIDNFSEYGSYSENIEPLPTFNEEPASNFNNSFPWRRAKRYLFRVLGIEPVFRSGDDESELVLSLRLLSSKE